MLESVIQYYHLRVADVCKPFYSLDTILADSYVNTRKVPLYLKGLIADKTAA